MSCLDTGGLVNYVGAYDSYGKIRSPYAPSLNLGNPAVFEIDTNGCLATHINISHSYGKGCSPYVSYSAYDVELDGNVDYDHYYMSNSYGNLYFISTYLYMNSMAGWSSG